MGQAGRLPDPQPAVGGDQDQDAVARVDHLGQPEAALRPGSDTTVTGAPASPSRQRLDLTHRIDPRSLARS